MAENGGPSRTELVVISDLAAYDRLKAEGFLPGKAAMGNDEGLDEVDADEMDENRVFLDKSSVASATVATEKRAEDTEVKEETDSGVEDAQASLPKTMRSWQSHKMSQA